ncbi:MAG: UDP-N-acetylmuramate dehydrogenase [Patescibacteria group bacterium]|nr:UDP-N-acetylmuramate dehydrogenase [Patescibacteria group bacterium]
MSQIYKQLIQELGFNRVKLDEPMKDHTNWKVGGSADLYLETKTSQELIEAVQVAERLKIPYVILGLGANVLVGDKGIRGLVVVNKAQEVKFLSFGFIEIDSGMSNAVLIKLTTDQRLSGLERLIRVPGSLGGAIFMNAGDTAKQAFIGELVRSVKVVDKNGVVRTLSPEDCDFGYRHSRFQTSGEIIVSAKLQLKETIKSDIEEKVRDILERKRNQPMGATAGSTFKNPPNNFAGKLIEEAGLKGKQIGEAKISEQHANFIVNTGNATASDIKALIDLVKERVKENSGVDLQEEIRYLGDF